MLLCNLVSGLVTFSHLNFLIMNIYTRDGEMAHKVKFEPLCIDSNETKL